MLNADHYSQNPELQRMYADPNSAIYHHPDIFSSPLLAAMVFLILFGALTLWLMPTVIAFFRQHPQRWNIFGLNLFIGTHTWGWTGLMARAWEVI